MKLACGAGRSTQHRSICTTKSNKAGVCTDEVGVCTNKVGGCSNKVGVCTDEVGVCTNKVGDCSNKVGVCTNKVGVRHRQKHSAPFNLHDKERAVSAHLALDHETVRERAFFFDNLLVRIPIVIEMILVDRPCVMEILSPLFR